MSQRPRSSGSVPHTAHEGVARDWGRFVRNLVDIRWESKRVLYPQVQVSAYIPCAEPRRRRDERIKPTRAARAARDPIIKELLHATYRSESTGAAHQPLCLDEGVGARAVDCTSLH